MENFNRFELAKNEALVSLLFFVLDSERTTLAEMDWYVQRLNQQRVKGAQRRLLGIALDFRLVEHDEVIIFHNERRNRGKGLGPEMAWRLSSNGATVIYATEWARKEYSYPA